MEDPDQTDEPEGTTETCGPRRRHLISPIRDPEALPGRLSFYCGLGGQLKMLEGGEELVEIEDPNGAEAKGNDPSDVQAQIQELNKKHKEAMATIARLNKGPPKSYVYVPRERHISPFSGDLVTDGRSVDDFIEEVERVLRTRNQSPDDQLDFVMSLLRGPALEEVRLRLDSEYDQTSDLFSYLKEAFREKRTAAQLLNSFYGRKQREGEDLRDFSHALSQIMVAITKRSSTAVANEKLALRDQFIEGVRDPSLRRELRKFVRDKPASTLIEVREEAWSWSLDESSANTKGATAKSKSIVSDHMVGETHCTAIDAREKKSVTLEDVLKVVAEQGKAINELTNAVKGLRTHPVGTSNVTGGKPRVQLKFTDDGKPICLKCQGVGHIARNCTMKRNVAVKDAVPTSTQGNENPRL